MKEVKLKVFGKVQGVFYRDTVRKKALSLGLSGFARNEQDGSVTVVARGSENGLGELLKAAEQGSSKAQVAKMEVEWRECKESEDEPNSFEVI